jgi:DNA-binding Lrp family transcriptional regulator
MLHDMTFTSLSMSDYLYQKHLTVLMAYKKQFKDEDFLNALSDEPRTTRVIARRVDCSRNTAISFLEKLTGEGKVKKIEVEGGTTTWVSIDTIDTDVNVEVEEEPTLADMIYEYHQKHPDDELAKKVKTFIVEQVNPWRVGQYIVWDSESVREAIDEHFKCADVKPKPKYIGELVFQITRCEINRIYVNAVGVVKIYSSILNFHQIYKYDKIRIATPEEVRIAEETPIPELKPLKEES